MLRSGESETEILLGNKQLLGIFFVVAVLLGVAFTAGFMVGRGAPEKKGATDASASSTHSTSAVETRTLPGDSSGDDGGGAPPLGSPASTSAATSTTSTATAESHRTAAQTGAPHATRGVLEPGPISQDGFTPQKGQRFLQVAAVSRDEALAIADVLHKKGFRAHAVPKPGSSKFYRVLIGPVRDASEQSSTRDALRKTGFREVIVQNY